MTDHITQTVTFDDLAAQYDDELDDLRDAYDDATDLITDEYGPDALERHVPDDPDDDRLERLAGLRQTRQVYDETAKTIQRRQNALAELAEEYDGDAFEISILSGTDLMAVETELKALARKRDVEMQEVQHERRGLVADRGTVDAPEDFPHEDDSPVPSQGPNPVMIALYEAIETLNNAGTTDFTAPGFGDGPDSGALATSATPTPSGSVSPPSNPTTSDTPDSGDS